MRNREQVAETGALGSRAAARLTREALALTAGVWLIFLYGSELSAQEAVRMSMASARAAEARKKAAASAGNYNLDLGPTVWESGVGLGLEYNDNVNYTETHERSDFILRPELNARMVWPVSDRNSLDLSLGAGYSAYFQESELSRYFIQPDSELSFDLYTGDFWIELHDRIAVTENAYQDPTAAGTGDYSQLENAVGVGALWDLNRAILRVGYDHQNYRVVSGEHNRPDGQSEVLSVSTGYAPREEVLCGVEVGGALLHYSGSSTLYSDAVQWNVGGFYETRASEYVNLMAHAGYTVYRPDSGATSEGDNDFNGVYAQVVLRHRVSRHVDYALSGSRTVQTTLQAGSVDLYSLSWQVNWRVIYKTALLTSFVYNNGSELYASGEAFEQFGPQVRLGWRLGEKLSCSVGYQSYWRTSDESEREYSVNIVSLNFDYAF